MDKIYNAFANQAPAFLKVRRMIDEVKTIEEFICLLNKFNILPDEMFLKTLYLDKIFSQYTFDLLIIMNQICGSDGINLEPVQIVSDFNENDLEEVIKLYCDCSNINFPKKFRLNYETGGNEKPFIKFFICPVGQRIMKRKRNEKIIGFLSEEGNIENLIRQAVETEINGNKNK